MMTRGTSLKIQNLTTNASLIFAGQCCVFKYRANTMSSEGGGSLINLYCGERGGGVAGGHNGGGPGRVVRK